MDKAALVSIDVERGAELIAALDRAKVKVSIALWVHLAEYGDWRLVLAGRPFDALDLREAYGLVHDSVAAAGFSIGSIPPVMIVSMSDPFVKALRAVFGKAKSVEGMRLGGQMIGDRFVEDAYVYRIA